MEFLGRKTELGLLEGLYASNRLQLVYLTGGRKIGKTALVKEFLRRKKNNVYFCLRPSTPNVNKAALYTELSLQGYSGSAEATEWNAGLERFFAKAVGEKLVLVIDRAEELEEAFPELLAFIEEELATSEDKLRLLVIFIGEELEYFKRKGHPFKRLQPLDICLEPLNYSEANAYLSSFTNEERIVLYGVTGGYPCFLQQLNLEVSLKENLQRLFFSENAPLLDLPIRILAEKLRKPSYYHAILCSVACGAVRSSEISAAVNMEYNKLSKYISVLVDLGLLKRIIPVDEQALKKQHKKTFYVLDNTMLQFWYQYVFPYLSNIELGQGGNLLRKNVMPALQDYCKGIFHRICLNYCKELNLAGQLRKDYNSIGCWWSSNEILTYDQLYLLGIGGKNALLASCHWDNQKVDLEELSRLDEIAHKMPYEELDYLIFSKRGFTDKLQAISARNPRIRLISLNYLK